MPRIIASSESPARSCRSSNGPFTKSAFSLCTIFGRRRWVGEVLALGGGLPRRQRDLWLVGPDFFVIPLCLTASWFEYLGAEMYRSRSVAAHFLTQRTGRKDRS